MSNTRALLLVSSLGLVATSPASASNPCGEPAGVYRDQAPAGYATREVHRFRAVDGSYTYSYRLRLDSVVPRDPVPAAGTAFSVEVSLNQHDAVGKGMTYCTSTSVEVIGDGRCVDPARPFAGTVEPRLFLSAADGDRLNSWTVVFRAIHPLTQQGETPVEVWLEEKGLSELTWE